MSTTRLSCLLSAIALLLFPALPAHAAEAAYRYDTVHSQIVFSIEHDGYSRPFGRLHVASGWLRFDADDWSHASTQLDIDLAGLDMGDAAWNAAVRKPAFLDAGHARYAHFASTSVERKDDRHGVLHGLLTLRGVTRPVSLNFTLNRVGSTIYGMHTIAGFSAVTTLNRSDFGMTSNRGSIGEQVMLWLELEAIRDNHAIPTSKDSP
jgi:polyisoprenoid-binding protein YceI